MHHATGYCHSYLEWSALTSTFTSLQSTSEDLPKCSFLLLDFQQCLCNYEVVQKDCQACNLNREDAVDRSRWKKLIKIGWRGGWVFLVIPTHPGSPRERAIKRLLLLLLLVLLLIIRTPRSRRALTRYTQPATQVCLPCNAQPAAAKASI